MPISVITTLAFFFSLACLVQSRDPIHAIQTAVQFYRNTRSNQYKFVFVKRHAREQTVWFALCLICLQYAIVIHLSIWCEISEMNGLRTSQLILNRLSLQPMAVWMPIHSLMLRTGTRESHGMVKYRQNIAMQHAYIPVPLLRYCRLLLLPKHTANQSTAKQSNVHKVSKRGQKKEWKKKSQIVGVTDTLM